MAIVVTHVCWRCGAPQGSAPRAWVRCERCDVLVAFDFQTWLESEDHAAWLARHGAQVAEWDAYTRDVAAADRAVAAGEHATAEGHLRRACARLFDLTPHVFPPEVHVDHERREAHLAYAVWWQRMQRLDPELRALAADLRANQARMDLRDPWPTIERSIALVAKQIERGERLEPPPDPDGLPMPARVRVAQSFLLSAYLHLLDPDRRLEALRALYGAARVVASVPHDDADGETDARAPDDALGLYFDFACPRCGLVTLTARGATEVTCVGCHHRRPFRDEDLRLGGVAFGCAACGAPLAIDATDLVTECTFCGAAQRRAARTGNVERAFARSVAATHALGGPAEEVVQGVVARPEQRDALVLAGLARQALWFAKLVSPRRFAGILRASLGERWRDEAVIARLVEGIRREGGAVEDAIELVRTAASSAPR
ncbi:MAG: hypothetical protein IT379_23015 [Deltaproteobacteria bacterium]|nr:hypothetical protein [Deltaproteobacteria bacterium]